MKDYRVIEPAYKHGIKDEDIIFVFERAVSRLILREEPEKVMLFGFDTAGRALKIGYFVNDQGEHIIMHAMKLRTGYKKYLV